MRILAVIPARAGSKRLPGKNTRLLAGKPLIAHTIVAALQSSCCEEIVVSTDSKQIADVAVQYGASVPWLRSEDLATDTSDVIHTVIDLLFKFQQMEVFFDSVLLLQPTSPFRKPETIRHAVEIHQATGKSVVSVSPIYLKPSWCRSIDSQGNLVKPELFQDLEIYCNENPIYKLNGSIYIATAKQIIENKSFYSEPTKPLLLNSISESIDIDTPIDWALTEKLMELNQEALV
ncbi:TPA: acylneuraminate cytidylyltransferase family protein [Legionella pneumophila]|nr:acylneuraminate cytidylyltransferase family protein [Legionella pneumophila]HAU0811424.1 acylneuraminate cytidylyltransferase family protein [Legionella pneumophila]HAU0906353.1 acylneuraminate cytidylyltransferase family protein [Legionella pneumophila]HDO9821938.1 CMP-N,N'-diacetyllegionaminic acid synthase [Legionella pneumophila]